jgi:integrase
VAKRVRIERGLYRTGDVFEACATPVGGRKAIWTTLGPVGLRAARAGRDEWAARVRAGGVTLGGHATVQEVADAWINHLEHLVGIGEIRPRTLESYRTGVDLHLGRLKRRQVRSITPDDLVAWHRDQRALEASEWSIRARWIAIRGVFAHAARHRLIVASPADQMLARERPKRGQSRQRFLAKQEMALLLEAQGRVVIALGLFTGMRASELLGLIWADIDFKRGEVHARYQMGRNGKRVILKTKAARRDIVLMPALARLLRLHRMSQPFSGEKDLVLQGDPGRTLGYWALRDSFEQACKDAGVEDATPHALRHTFASILIDQGRPVDYVSRQLGHKDTSTTWNTYVHLFEARRHADEAREALEAEYGDLLKHSSSKNGK